jgi:hypothetical protein
VVTYIYLLYSIESEILKNTQRDIFHICTSEEDIDHMTFSNLLLSVSEISQFFAWDYIINRTLHGGLKISLLSSRVKNNILHTRCARS